MNIYVIGMALTLVLIGTLKLAGVDRAKKDRYIFVFAVVFWGGIMAIRGISVGTDTWNYQELFKEASRFSLREMPGYYLFRRCPAYVLYSKLVSVFFSNPQAIVFMNSVVYIWGTVLVLYRNSDNFGISVILLLVFHNYFYAMNAARMSIAVMFVMWAYHYGVRGQRKRSMLFIALAVLTHSIAIAGIIPMMLSWIKMNRLRAGTILAVCSVTIPSMRAAAAVFIRIFPEYAGYLDRGNGWNNIFYEGGGGGRRALIALFLLAVFGLCLAWKLRNRMILENDQLFWRLLVICGIAVLSMVIWRKVYIFARLEYFFTYFFMLFLPFCVEHFFKKQSRLIAYTGIVAVLLVPFYVKLGDYLPYVTFLD